MIQDIIEREPSLKTGICITGTGRALPARAVSNSEFARRLDTTDEWIRTRTGIEERRFAEPDETTSQYAARAALEALASARIRAEDIDLILLSTTTPDKRFPPTANIVQREIGAIHAYAYDITVACSGFIFALSSAHAQIKAGLAQRALVISAEIYSSIMDFTDRNTCVLFGDGAGAVVLERRESGSLASGPYGPTPRRGSLDPGFINDDRSEDLLLPGMLHNSGIRNPESFRGVGPSRPEAAIETSGILALSLRSDATSSEVLTCEGGGTENRTQHRLSDNGTIRMRGKQVFMLAVRTLTERSRDVLDRAGMTLDDVDCIIPHQANIRIVERLAHQLGCSMDKMFTNLHKYGNTSSASIPIALDEALRSGRVRSGDVVLCAAAGAGFSSGAVLVRM